MGITLTIIWHYGDDTGEVSIHTGLAQSVVNWIISWYSQFAWNVGHQVFVVRGDL